MTPGYFYNITPTIGWQEHFTFFFVLIQTFILLFGSITILYYWIKRRMSQSNIKFKANIFGEFHRKFIITLPSMPEDWKIYYADAENTRELCKEKCVHPCLYIEDDTFTCNKTSELCLCRLNAHDDCEAWRDVSHCEYQKKGNKYILDIPHKANLHVKFKHFILCPTKDIGAVEEMLAKNKFLITGRGDKNSDNNKHRVWFLFTHHLFEIVVDSTSEHSNNRFKGYWR